MIYTYVYVYMSALLIVNYSVEVVTIFFPDTSTHLSFSQIFLNHSMQKYN